MSLSSSSRSGQSGTSPKCCAIYTRVSTDSGLDQDFNSLDAQREACEAYIKSQAHEGWRRQTTRYDDGGFSGGSMERPALQSLLASVEAGEIDIVVVYKIDRLTRSLTDFAKLVEVFDTHGVSFVSVTQAFNTTTSMGRLTFNVLLSFAQFEREVTGERIRDKIAASKKKGMWMGGVVPLGYRVEARALHPVEEHAEIVRSLFRRYLETANVLRLKLTLDEEGFRLPTRINGKGQRTGGGRISRGHLRVLLSNPLYRGEIRHKGHCHRGQHEPIVPADLWDAVQSRLHEQAGSARRDHQSTDSPLVGKLFDDRGNRMTPSWSQKESRRYRYYVSKAVRPGEGGRDRGSITRVSAPQIEEAVCNAMFVAFDTNADLAPARMGSVHSNPAPQDQSVVLAQVIRVDIGPKQLRITYSLGDNAVRRSETPPLAAVGDYPTQQVREATFERSVQDQSEATTTIIVPWHKPVATRKRHVISGPAVAEQALRPMRIEARQVFTSALSNAHEWLDELIENPEIDIATVARRAGKSERSVRMTLSLALLCPDLISAAIDGTLPRGFGTKRLVELPAAWPAQWAALGLSPRKAG